uniref:Epidermal patterning factor-like protein n=2 Tax=Nicotiana TaxID=4085 RepID=A0A1S4B391_TOBAC|nr:PREDICTED: EPIDERMAL PATTERNING FACTOR-like protein 2 [Nicotiana sylvestris]XP_016483306.1 PREDICTED: EPIDERMAL PATTERNING FACTOR-like protein 2 [Nicotiana tabacum]
MGCTRNFTCRQTLPYLTISFLILMILSFSHLTFKAEGRILHTTHGHDQTESEKNAIFRSQIGSRPPRCEKRCGSCGHCEAIQVPTNPQITNGNKNHTAATKASSSSIAYARDDDNSNYKPMSWKCKCGNLIFNP